MITSMLCTAVVCRQVWCNGWWSSRGECSSNDVVTTRYQVVVSFRRGSNSTVDPCRTSELRSQTRRLSPADTDHDRCMKHLFAIHCLKTCEQLDILSGASRHILPYHLPLVTFSWWYGLMSQLTHRLQLSWTVVNSVKVHCLQQVVLMSALSRHSVLRENLELSGNLIAVMKFREFTQNTDISGKRQGVAVKADSSLLCQYKCWKRLFS